MTLTVAIRCAFLLVIGAVSAKAQVPFQLLVTQSGNAFQVQNGATLAFSAPVGQVQRAQIRATYSGAGQALIGGLPAIFGSTAFAVTFSGSLPLTLDPGSNVSFEIEFSPTDAAQTNAQFSLAFRETIPPAGGATTPTTTVGSISFALVGTAPSFVLSYVLQADQNVIPLQPGGAILYPATLVDTTSQAALNVTNVGSGAGSVTGISIAGNAFRLTGLPLIPVTLAAGQNLQVFVLYRPTGVSADIGQVTISFAGASPVTINLQGSGTAAGFAYQVFQADQPTTVPPGGTVVFTDTDAGQTSSLAVQIVNTGNASGTVSAIAVTGQGFLLNDTPVLPQTLAPNASLTFTVTFAPSVPGSSTGRLIVNSDILNLRGVGLGPRLSFSYVTNGTTITLGAGNNSVIFTPVRISESSRLSLAIRNTGTLPATISNIGVGQTNSPFSVAELPALPVSLAPEAEFVVPITFTPLTLGFSNGTLLIDTTTISLVGSGTQPPELPAYRITGPGATAPPAAQPIIGLSLENPYPVAIAGTLTLGVSGNLPADPAVQFSTGGRTVSFVIPANGADAVFGGQGTRIGLQTGTVAGTVTLTPSFATQAGNVDLNPATPAVLQFAVAPAAPVLTVARISGQTANSFVIGVTGFTTTRTLTNWRIEFTPAAGVSIAASQFTIDIQQIAAAWFAGATSQAFGGQFSMAIPIIFQGVVPSGQSLLNRIAAVAVTLDNEAGTSNSLQVRVQ